MCTQYGSTALYFAASNGQKEVTELLLGAGADPDLTYKVIRLTLTASQVTALLYQRVDALLRQAIPQL